MIIDVTKAFSASLSTSLLEYIRHYNFDANTSSDIIIDMQNSDEETPITVDITIDPDYDWIDIVDSRGHSVKSPAGNIVLQPSSTDTARILIDLPPEYDTSDISDKLNVEVVFKLEAGSHPSTNTTTNVANTIVFNGYDADNPIITVQKGDTITVGVTVYNSAGKIDSTNKIEWLSDNRLVFTTDSSAVLDDQSRSAIQRYTGGAVNLTRTNKITGIGVGEATLTVTAGTSEGSIRVKVIEVSDDEIIPDPINPPDDTPPLVPPPPRRGSPRSPDDLGTFE